MSEIRTIRTLRTQLDQVPLPPKLAARLNDLAIDASRSNVSRERSHIRRPAGRKTAAVAAAAAAVVLIAIGGTYIATSSPGGSSQVAAPGNVPGNNAAADLSGDATEASSVEAVSDPPSGSRGCGQVWAPKVAVPDLSLNARWPSSISASTGATISFDVVNSGSEMFTAARGSWSLIVVKSGRVVSRMEHATLESRPPVEIPPGSRYSDAAFLHGIVACEDNGSSPLTPGEYQIILVENFDEQPVYAEPTTMRITD